MFVHTDNPGLGDKDDDSYFTRGMYHIYVDFMGMISSSGMLVFSTSHLHFLVEPDHTGARLLFPHGITFIVITFRGVYGASHCNSVRNSCSNSHHRNCLFIQVGAFSSISNTILMLEYITMSSYFFLNSVVR